MPNFTYVARSREGKRETGKMTAENRQVVIRTLQGKGMVPERVDAVGAGKKAHRDPKVKTAELLVFTRQLSTIVNAGLPLLQGLDILAEQTEDPRYGAVIQGIADDVEAGETFSDALRKHPRIYSDLFVSMIRAGEASGNLDGVLMQLAEYLESMEELKRRIRSAMTYPVVALSMILIIAAGLVIFVVPQFAAIFEGFGRQLPAPTRILIAASTFLKQWYGAPLIVASIIGLVLGIRMYGSTSAGRLHLDAIKLRIPIFGKLLRKVAISRFARTLSTLTRSGVNILGAMEIVERTAGNEVFARAISNAADCVRNGETLADPLARSGQFPAMVTRMIGVGEKTGALEQMLQKVSDFYDSEVRAAVDALTSMIEPILILAMGLVVGGIVVALFMPILQLSSLVQQ
ncbi:MAG TPA: type II secretion system F family protein [Candidatus Hydrogenedentes bacterium]|mgnify:FL=1|nr:type II secretion system F family protein [Candidatus Hydrogenedentota bacterium]HQM47557.1 type II secretion system F family protein [Candidatus Hydrogenedentota bacterium]